MGETFSFSGWYCDKKVHTLLRTVVDTIIDREMTNRMPLIGCIIPPRIARVPMSRCQPRLQLGQLRRQRRVQRRKEIVHGITCGALNRLVLVLLVQERMEWTEIRWLLLWYLRCLLRCCR